jgi:hypothetical protein
VLVLVLREAMLGMLVENFDFDLYCWILGARVLNELYSWSIDAAGCHVGDLRLAMLV